MPFRSDKLLYRLVLALSAIVATSLGRRDASAHGERSSRVRCTMEILPGARDSLTTTLLGRATRDTIEAGAGVVDLTWIGSRRAIYGQVVRVDSMLGPGADLARQALNARQSNEILVVPWGNSPGCGIDVWRQSALWTTPDSSGLFSLRLRPASAWVSGRPTFDAFYAANYSYAYGPYTVGPQTEFREPTGTKLEGSPSMTPAEVFALYAALPSVAQSGDSLAIARLRAWVRANPGVRTRYPGNHILQYWPLDPSR